MSYIINYPFILVFFLVSFFLFIFMIFIKSFFVKIFLLFSFSIVFSFFLVEVILSFFLNPFITDSYIIPINRNSNSKSYFPKKSESFKVSEILLEDKNIAVFFVDDEYINKAKKFIGDKEVIVEAIYTIDENGLRYTKANKLSNSSFLFFGCSFVFGAMVNDNETLPYCFSENLGFSKNVINLGRDARGINRAYSMLVSSDYIKSLLGDSKVESIFYEFQNDHVNRAFRYNMPSDVLLYEKDVEYEVKQPFRIIKKYFTKCLIYERFLSNFFEKYSNKFYYEYIQKIFLKMYNISKQRYNADFVVIMWDSNETLEKYFLENNINFIKAYNFLDYSDDVVKFDVHPNVFGNRKIADLCVDYIKSKGVV